MMKKTKSRRQSKGYSGCKSGTNSAPPLLVVAASYYSFSSSSSLLLCQNARLRARARSERKPRRFTDTRLRAPTRQENDLARPTTSLRGGRCSRHTIPARKQILRRGVERLERNYRSSRFEVSFRLSIPFVCRKATLLLTPKLPTFVTHPSGPTICS